jgi:hypothetical protein
MSSGLNKLYSFNILILLLQRQGTLIDIVRANPNIMLQRLWERNSVSYNLLEIAEYKTFTKYSYLGPTFIS